MHTGDELFKSVFNNIVLFRNIFNHVRLYKRNECVKFNSRIQLLEYKERSYISILIYSCDEMLQIGDLPIGGVLKHVKFKNKALTSIEGEAIPYGVEILKYSDKGTNDYDDYDDDYDDDDYNSEDDNTITTPKTTITYERMTPLSTLPPTIHTVKNYIILPESQENIITNKHYYIPPNIRSIKFEDCPNISNNKGGITIPNTVKSLTLHYSKWNNDRIELKKGDIPEGLTKLSMLGYVFKSNISKGLLPNSIKNLKISSYFNQDNSFLNYIPPNLEKFHLYCENDVTLNSNLFKFTSIKKFILIFKWSNHKVDDYLKIERNSLPPNITDLSLGNISKQFPINLIPNSVKKLELRYLDSLNLDNSLIAIPNTVVSLSINQIITNPGYFPPSLTNLEIIGNTYSQRSLIKIVSILPPSLTSLTLPKNEFMDKIEFPSTINKISYIESK